MDRKGVDESEEAILAEDELRHRQLIAPRRSTRDLNSKKKWRESLVLKREVEDLMDRKESRKLKLRRVAFDIGKLRKEMEELGLSANKKKEFGTGCDILDV